MIYVLTEQEANAYSELHSVGSEIPEPILREWGDIRFIRTLMESKLPFGVEAGDRESPLAFEVLGNSGIYHETFGKLSKEVTEFIGQERLLELKKNYGENWETAAAFEYCWLNLPHSSPAFVAASYQYHHYITQDDFSAGYNWRDLEIMVHGVEAEALKAIETRKRAGKSGSEKSSNARRTRRTDLFTKMELVAERNPDMVKLGADTIAKVALQECLEENEVLWRQGSGQVWEYLGEIRRGEAGSDMQERYRVLFGDKPPRRFKGLP